MYKFLFTITIVINVCCLAQIPDSIIVKGQKIENQILNEITLTLLNLSPEDYSKYYNLLRKTHKVYPFALKAKQQLVEIEEDLEHSTTRREKRKIARLHEQWLQDNFTDELKKLTRSEGRILIKLIHLETGTNAYQLIKNYRNGLKARLWQALAKFYDGDLKSTFDPENNKEDKWIEHILWRMKKDKQEILKSNL